jgi:2-C-methyl-D-erythritol 2,4-cyclodiphosphate synthase
MRIGTGFDAHPLVEGRALVIGGVNIPHPRGLAGHSDADVLCHALADALLGAAALGDLGREFGEADPELAGASSLGLLRRVHARITAAGWSIVNLDAVVIAEQPRLATHLPAIRAALASCLGSPIEAISVKATSTNGLGFPGRGEGMAAQAVVLLASRDPEA